MPRKRIHHQAPLSNAEKQKRHREKRKAELETLKAAASEGTRQNQAAIRETIKKELQKTWEPELKAQRLAAQRKQGRELAKKAGQTRSQGRTIGICETADYLIGKGRPDIARAVLTHFCINRETAAAALEADKRTKSLTLESLDKSKAWGKPPPIIK
jgi:predicted nucleotide-binding protein